MLGQQQILVAVLREEFAGIDEKHAGIRLGTLFQDNDACGDAHTEEQVAG